MEFYYEKLLWKNTIVIKVYDEDCLLSEKANGTSGPSWYMKGIGKQG